MPARIFPDNSDWSPPLGPTEKDACGTTNEDGTFSNSWMLDDEPPDYQEILNKQSMKEAIADGLDPHVAEAMYMRGLDDKPKAGSPEFTAYEEWLEKTCPRSLLIAEGLLDPDD